MGAIMDTADALGYIAAGLVFMTFYMTSMTALRAVAVGSNLCFLAYGTLAGLPPVVVLHAALLPLNLVRLKQATETPGCAGGSLRRGQGKAVTKSR